MDDDTEPQDQRPSRSASRGNAACEQGTPCGVIVYQMTIRYAFYNGAKVTGGVRVILDLPNKHGYVQVISLKNEVYLTHYATTMCFLNPGSAAAVAWSALPWSTGCDEDCNKCGGVKEPGGMLLSASRCSRVESVQVVFCDPSHAQRFKVVLDTIRTAFCDGPDSGVSCAPTGLDGPRGGSMGYNNPNCYTSQVLQPLVPGCAGVCCPPGFGAQPGCGGGGYFEGGVTGAPGGGGYGGAPNMTQSQTPNSYRFSHDNMGQFVPIAPGGVGCDPYAYAGTPGPNTPMLGGDPYHSTQDRILFSAPACLVRLEKKKNWREMFRGTLKIAQRSVGCGFSMMLESMEGTICSHHFITSDMRFERSCKTQFGYIFSAISRGMRCGVRPCMGNSVCDDFLISFQCKAPFDQFKLVVDDIMKCLATCANNIECGAGGGGCPAPCTPLCPPERNNNRGVAAGGWSNNNAAGIGQGMWGANNNMGPNNNMSPNNNMGLNNNMGPTGMCSSNNNAGMHSGVGNNFMNGAHGNLFSNGFDGYNVAYNPTPPKLFNDTNTSNAVGGFINNNNTGSQQPFPGVSLSNTGRNVPPFNGMFSNVNQGPVSTGLQQQQQQQQAGSSNNNACSVGQLDHVDRFDIGDQLWAQPNRTISRLDAPMFSQSQHLVCDSLPTCGSSFRRDTCNNNNASVFSHNKQHTNQRSTDKPGQSRDENGSHLEHYSQNRSPYIENISFNSKLPGFITSEVGSFESGVENCSASNRELHGPSAAKRPAMMQCASDSMSATTGCTSVRESTTLSAFSSRLHNCIRSTNSRKRFFSGK